MRANGDDKLFQFRIDPDTEEKLSKLADSTERTKSAFLRWIIQREYAEVFEGTNGAQEAEPAPEN